MYLEKIILDGDGLSGFVPLNHWISLLDRKIHLIQEACLNHKLSKASIKILPNFQLKLF